MVNYVADGRITGRRWEQGGTIQRRYYHTDALGSVVAISREDGAVTATAEYDPWGKMLASQGMDDYDNTFVGAYGVRRMWNPTGDKYIMGVRHYDAEVGRFLSEDPIGLQGGDVNLYRYAKNNALRVIDPSGLRVLICRRPLTNWSDGTNTGPDSNMNPLYHRYICVNTSCSGLGPSGDPNGSSGTRTIDPYYPEMCSEVQSTPCLENCLMGKLLGPRPYYDWLQLVGINCHTWVDVVMDECNRACPKNNCKIR